MKIIHTSDWHLGQTFYDYDRHVEHEQMLRQIVEIARTEQPDALVVSGDIYNTANPPVSAIKLYNSALLELRRACPNMQIVVTGGNHDGAARLEVNNHLWDHFGVTVIGNVARVRQQDDFAPDFDSHIVEVHNAKQELVGFIVAVPHCYESNFPAFDRSLQRYERAEAYFGGLMECVAERNTAEVPVVLMAHLAVDGCDMSGHDNIGGIETRDVSVLGSGYDYAALGHIHSPHNITERVRYCGTPIAVNFGEKHEHSVSVVTLHPGRVPQIETRIIKNPIPLVDFPEQPAPFAEVLEAIKDYPQDHLCYMRLLVKVDGTMTPLAGTLVAEATKNKQCRVCKIQTFEDKPIERGSTVQHELTGEQLRAKTPLEIAEMFFELRGLQMSDTQREMIREATIAAEKIINEGENET